MMTVASAFFVRLSHSTDHFAFPLAAVGQGQILGYGLGIFVQPSLEDRRYVLSDAHRAWFAFVRCNLPGLVIIHAEPYNTIHSEFYAAQARKRPDIPAWSVLAEAPRIDQTGNGYVFIDTAAGWPALALGARFKARYDAQVSHFGDYIDVPIKDSIHADTPWGSSRDFTALPLRPIWPGFAINTAFYAVCYLLVSVPLGAALRAAARRRRRRRGLCIRPRCGYPLAGLDTCPECGSQQRDLTPHTTTAPG